MRPQSCTGAELLIMAKGAENRLNALQAHWAASLVGAKGQREVRGSLAIAECGWHLRLGTAMIEKSIITLARVSLLPHSHPSRISVQLASQVPCDSWVQRVCLMMSSEKVPSAIPRIGESELCPPDLREQAYGDAAIRKNLLRMYKTNMVRPIMLEYDHLACDLAVKKWLPALQCEYN